MATNSSLCILVLLGFLLPLSHCTTSLPKCVVQNLIDVDNITINYNTPSEGQTLVAIQNASAGNFTLKNSAIVTVNATSESNSTHYFFNVSSSSNYTLVVNDTDECYFTTAYASIGDPTCGAQNESDFQLSWTDPSSVTVSVTEVTDSSGRPANFSTSSESGKVVIDGLDSGYSYIVTISMADSDTGIEYSGIELSDDCLTSPTVCNVAGNADLASMIVSKNTSSESVRVTFEFASLTECCSLGVSGDGATSLFDISPPYDAIFLADLNNDDGFFTCNLDNATLGLDINFSCDATETTIKGFVASGYSVNSLQLLNSTVTPNGNTFSNLDPEKNYTLIFNVTGTGNDIEYIYEQECSTNAMVAPTDLTLTDRTKTSLSVSWSYAPGEAESFALECTPDCGSFNALPLSSTFYLIENLTEATSYSVSVKSVIGNFSSEAEIKTFTTLGDCSVEGSDLLTSLTIELNAPSENEVTVIVGPDASTTTVSLRTETNEIASVSSSLAYNLQVRSEYFLNLESQSGSYSCVFDNNTVAVDNAINHNSTETTIGVSIELESGNHVMKSIAVYSESDQKVDSVDGNVASYKFSGLIPGTNYKVKFESESETGIRYVNTLTISTQNIIAPHILQLSPGKTSMTVTWNYTGEAENFILTCSPDCNGENNVSSELRTYAIANLSPNTNYSVSLIAVIGEVNSTVIEQTSQTLIVPKPNDFQVTEVSETSVELSWSYTDNAGDQVQFNVACNSGPSCPSSRNVNSRITTFNDLVPGALYTFECRTVFQGHSSEAETVTFRMDIFQPDLSDLQSKLDNSNRLSLPIVSCDHENQVLSSAIVFWAMGACNGNLNSKTFIDDLNNCSAQFVVDLIEDDVENTVEFGSAVCVKLELYSDANGFEKNASSNQSINLYPDSLASVTCAETSVNSLSFSWSINSGLVNSYKVDFDSTVESVGSEPTNKEYSGLPQGTLYRFTVSAVSNGLEGSPFTVEWRTDVEEPGFTVEAVLDGSVYKVNVSLNPISPASDDLQVSFLLMNNTGTCEEIQTTGVLENETMDARTVTPYEFEEVVIPGTTYCVGVLLFTQDPDPKNNSAFETIKIPPIAPVVNVINIGSTSVDLNVVNQQQTAFSKFTYSLGHFPLYSDSLINDRSADTGVGTEAISDLTPGTVYEISVTVEASNGLNETSEAETFHTKPSTPTKVTDNVTSTSCQVTVQSEQIVTHFRHDNDKKSTISGQATFSFSGLDPHTSYTFDIVAVSSYRNSESESQPYTFECKTPHDSASPPTNVDLQPLNVNSGLYRFSWGEPENPNGDIVRYEIEANWNRSSSFRVYPEESTKENVTASTRSKTLDVAQGYTLRVRVRAWNDFAGEWSNLKNITRPISASSEPKVNEKYDGQEYKTEIREKSERTKSTITVFFPCDLFSDISDPSDISGVEFGIVEFYKMIVTKGESPITIPEEVPSSGDTYLAKDSFFPEECTRSRQKRSSDGAEWSFEAGTNEGCEENDQFCNRKLAADKTYSINLRAFADEDNYNDFDAGSFKTDKDAIATGLLVAIVLIAVLTLSAAALVVVFFVARKRICRGVNLRRRKAPKDVVDSSALCSVCQSSEPCDCTDAAKLVERMKKPIAFSKVREELERLKQGTNFQDEYADLVVTMRDPPALSRRRGLEPEFREKNRFPDVLPFDDRLVPLEEGYINASFISGELRDKEYIATQGPMERTQNDFWQMIWEHEVTQVVMLCMPRELKNGQIRYACHEYWPCTVGQTQWKGGIRVTLEKEEAFEVYWRRVFKIRAGDPLGTIPEDSFPPERELFQYHYSRWEDQQHPNYDEIIPFIKVVKREKQDENPTVVHCSAGVGRTGTFIAADRMIKQINYRSDFDIRGMVAEMRTMRPLMVQTLPQYQFLHELAQKLAEDIQTGPSRGGTVNEDFLGGPSRSRSQVSKASGGIELQDITVNASPEIQANGQTNFAFEIDLTN